MKTLKDVLDDILPFPEDFDMKTGTLALTISSGYVTLTRRNKPEHGIEATSFSYHPEGICEGKGICIHCGCTLFNY